MSVKSLCSIALTATLALLTVAGLMVLMDHSAHASPDVRYVAPGGDCGGATPCYATLQEAVDASQPGDEIRVAAGIYTGVQGRPAPSGYPGTVALITQVVYISQPLALRGGYTITNWTTPDPDANPAIVDAQGQGRGVFISGENITVTLERLRITRGNATDLQGGYANSDAGGGIYALKSMLTLSVTTVYSNVACADGGNGYGGGVFVSDSAAVTMTRNAILSNTAATLASGNGGGVYQSGGRLTFTDNTVRDNRAGPGYGYGGGLYLWTDDGLIDNNILEKNTAQIEGGTAGYAYGHGGGIYATGGVYTITRNTIRENTASRSATTTGAGYGGGIQAEGVSALLLADNTIISNTANVHHRGYTYTGFGGGASVDAGSTGTAIIEHNAIFSNTASVDWNGRGGGLYLSRGTTTIRGNTLQYNVASRDRIGEGGGLYLFASSPEIAGNTFAHNVASRNGDGDGGGAYLDKNVAHPILDGNLVISNTATLNGAAIGRGGGLFLEGAYDSVRLVNNLLARNDATTGGSGLWAGSGSNLLSAQLLHTTIADNNSSGEGVRVNKYATLVFTNTIVAGYTTVGITATADAVVTMTYTLWHGNGTHTGGAGTFSIAHDIPGDPDPAFADPAAWDYHLTAGSPAIDAGTHSGVRTDFEGDPRPANADYDLGADEYTIVAVQLSPGYTGRTSFGTTVYAHTLTNLGNYTDAFSLSCHSSQGWVQIGPPGPITLAQGATHTVWVTLTIPHTVLSGTVDTTVVTATSGRDGSVYATTTDTTTVWVLHMYIPLVLRNDGP